jgi:hypothetical protein
MTTEVTKALAPVKEPEVITVPTIQRLWELIDEAERASMGRFDKLRVKNEAMKGFIRSLREEMKQAVMTVEYAAKKRLEAEKLAIDLGHEQVLINIRFAFAEWLNKVGGQRFAQTILNLTQFNEQLEQVVKVGIIQSKASPAAKEQLLGAVDVLWQNMFKTIFGTAMQLLNQPHPGS